jgi:hypothetical protein
VGRYTDPVSSLPIYVLCGPTQHENHAGDIKTIVTIVSSLVLRKRVGKKSAVVISFSFFGGYFNYSLVLKIIRYVQYRLQQLDKVEKGGGITRFKFLAR